ncbi:carboxylesterase/lipase family protein [Nonomuraea typhae]|uniref:carboxylesterase/lipase family protein n=1 Tax=Nonomuraea typhae TaxID=2603600 RepID=UPI0012FC99F2|nr:carboxylesterase family protein [Nonomuraea typhae]
MSAPTGRTTGRRLKATAAAIGPLTLTLSLAVPAAHATPAHATPAHATPAHATPAHATYGAAVQAARSAAHDSGGTARPVVRTGAGAVAGVASADGLRRFTAIPYAAAPTGDLRWRPPRPARAWKGVRDASGPAVRCAQNANPADSNPASAAEDCLYLNITTPDKAQRSARGLPVMVWLHGGGFTQGAGGDYDAGRLARAGAMVVTVNYRLGIFGFLGHPHLAGSGAFGLLDQQAALRWVRRNAAAFGGDAANVTLFGESAGGFSTCAQLTSPRAAGLFDKVIIQSGTCSMRRLGIDPAGGDAVWPARRASERIAAAAAGRLGCTGAALRCLRKAPVAALLGAQQAIPATWAPAHGTPALPLEPGRALAQGRIHRVPVMAGGTADEARYFTAMYFDGPGRPLDDNTYRQFLRIAFGRDAARVAARYPVSAYGSPSLAWAAVATDRAWSCPARLGNRQLARKVAVYQFEFADRAAPRPAGFAVPRSFPLGAYHGGELAYLFDGPGAAVERPLSPGQRRLAAQMIGHWTRFAATGDPNGPGLPRWKPGAGHVRTLAVSDGPARHRCALWASLGR